MVGQAVSPAGVNSHNQWFGIRNERNPDNGQAPYYSAPPLGCDYFAATAK